MGRCIWSLLFHLGCKWKSFLLYSLSLLFFFHPIFSILLPSSCHCKNNDEIAFNNETLLCARTCVTHLINIMSSNHDCKLGWIFFFNYETFQTFRKIESDINVLNTYDWQYFPLAIFASANFFLPTHFLLFIHWGSHYSGVSVLYVHGFIH